ncbi:hypothetical protein [Youxingia wuxianensis]|uniref:Sodium pump decarboxylase gamma subunit n=1 Tax=Youxingia wuxianensis TaxID=2763678 RepID=A0A926EQH6_9FIRM|nr:hypothetical protein [Youxingia wuxianensis]MBC8585557.1 hypothetical protein [Youxingia wuxianensis]
MSAQVMENFYKALELMGKGMLGIFVVILVITLVVVLLTKVGGVNKKASQME